MGIFGPYGSAWPPWPDIRRGNEQPVTIVAAAQKTVAPRRQAKPGTCVEERLLLLAMGCCMLVVKWQDICGWWNASLWRDFLEWGHSRFVVSPIARNLIRPRHPRELE